MKTPRNTNIYFDLKPPAVFLQKDPRPVLVFADQRQMSNDLDPLGLTRTLNKDKPDWRGQPQASPASYGEVLTSRRDRGSQELPPDRKEERGQVWTSYLINQRWEDTIEGVRGRCERR